MRRQGSNVPGPRGMTGQVSSAALKRETRNFSEHRDVEQGPNINPSGRLLGFKQNVFADQTNLSKGGVAIQNASINCTEVNYMDPSADVQLDQNELAEIFARPYMDPNFPKYGYKSDSNQIYQIEQQLIEQKRDKVVEIFKQSTEVFEILDAAKKDASIIQATNGGKGLDPQSMCESLFGDRHFVNRKYAATGAKSIKSPFQPLLTSPYQ